MRPPSRWLTPGAATAMPPPARPSGGGAREPEGPPHSPPPLPLRPKSGRRQNAETAAPHPPRRGRCTRGGGAPRPRQVPARPARCRPTADRRRPGRRKRSGPPLPPPPPRRTGPSAADRTAPDARGRPATPTARVYPGGPRRRQSMAGRRPTGRGGGGAAPPPPPPLLPPSLGATGAALRPPGAEGTPPPPRRDREAGGGGDAAGPAHRAPKRPQPPASAGVAAAGRAHTRVPEQRAHQAWGRRTAAHGGASEQYGGRALHDPPVTAAHSGRAEGGFRSAGAPGGAVHGPPLTPPHPGAAPRPQPHAHAGRECADDTRGARTEYRRPPLRRGAGRPRRDPPPPPPPPARKPRGPRPPSPEAGGMVPPPARERSRSATCPPPQPPAPTGAAENKQARANAPGRRTDRAQRRRASTNWSGIGGHAPHGQHDTSDTRFVACPGKAEGRNEAERPPALQAPPGSTNGGYGARPPPPQKPAPRHTNATDPPRGAQPPQGVQAEGTEKGLHTRTPAPTARG